MVTVPVLNQQKKTVVHNIQAHQELSVRLNRFVNEVPLLLIEFDETALAVFLHLKVVLIFQRTASVLSVSYVAIGHASFQVKYAFKL